MDNQELITAIENVRRDIDVEESFNFIYHQTHAYVESRIRFYVHGRKTASYDIEDITQDVYIYMSTHLSKLKEPKAFWSWTDKIASGKTNDFFDSRQGKTIVSENALEIKTGEDDEIEHDIVDSKISNNPEQRAMQNVTVAAVREILADLTDAQKEVIIPFFLYNKKEREIAEDLNLNLNTVKSRLKSGKDAIYKRKTDLRKRGVEIAVIPFVLLLHVAYRSDEALAATLMAGMAKATLSHGTSAGATEAGAGVKASAGASKAAAGTGEAAKAAGTAAGGAKTAGMAGISNAAAMGGTGAAKAIGTGIAVKAVAAVAAVTVAAGGGAMVYKNINTPSSSIASSLETTDTESLPAEATETTAGAAEESSAVNNYVDVYRDVLQEFATEHNFSLDELNIGLFDFDQNGVLEMTVSAGYEVTSSKGTYFEAIYTIADSVPKLIAESDWSITYTQTESGAYFSTEAVIGTDIYSERGESLWLLKDGTCERVATEWFAADHGGNEVLGQVTDQNTADAYIRERIPFDTEKYVSETEILSYEDISTLRDEEILALINNTAEEQALMPVP